jgi:dolichol-phosphate mannosyltransferase
MIVVMLPAYNEGEALPRLVPKLIDAGQTLGDELRIVVCDDGSNDGTADVLDQFREMYPLDVITHRYNRGLGESVRDLIEYAVEVTVPGDFIVRMDCDDTHEPQYIATMIERARSGYDVVIASRFVDGGGQVGVNAYRRFVSRVATLFMRTLFRIDGLNEYTSGFRVYRAEILHRAIATYGNNFVQLKGLGFTCTLEKLVKLKLLGARFGEEPFVLRYDNKVGESKMVTSVTTFGYFTMAVLYHWPWGGWRATSRRRPGGQSSPTDPVV